MARIYDPVQLKHPMLRECAYQAAWIAALTEAAEDLEDLLSDVPAEERVLPDFRSPWPWEFDRALLSGGSA